MPLCAAETELFDKKSALDCLSALPLLFARRKGEPDIEVNIGELMDGKTKKAIPKEPFRPRRNGSFLCILSPFLTYICIGFQKPLDKIFQICYNDVNGF